MTELRTPPHNLDAEHVVLSSMMLDETDRSELAAIVRADWFYHGENQAMFQLLRDMIDREQPIEPTSVAIEAQQQGKLKAIGGAERVLLVCEFTSATPKHYAAILERNWLRRRLINLGRELMDQGYADDTDPQEVLAGIADHVIELQAGKSSAEVRLSDSISETLASIDSRVDTPAGIQTGYTGLDGHLGGLRPGQLIVIAARPAVGKSALALGISQQVAATAGGVLFVSLEMSHTEQTERLLAAASSVNSRSLLSGRLTDDESGKIVEASRGLRPLPLFYLDQAFDSDTIIQSAKALHSKHKLSLIVCDYLQLCEVNGIPETQRERAVAKLSRSFKRLAQQLQIPVIVLSQLNRAVEKRTDKRPVLSDLRESGAIEQDANVVLFLHRPELYDAEDQPGIAELIVGKNRNGSVGVVPMRFVKEFTRFENLEADSGLDWAATI